MSGFSATGIWPYNENEFDDSEYVPYEVTERPNPRLMNSPPSSVPQPSTSCKKKVDTSNWKKENVKIKINSGEGNVPRSGKAVPAKIFASVTRCCTSECFKMVSAKQHNTIFTEFWSIGDKQKQDTLLASYVEKKEVMSSANDTKSGKKSTELLLNLQVSESRMKTVLREVNLGNVSPQENRGKHDNRPSNIGNHIWEMVTEHSDIFTSKNSHYVRSKSESKYFDDPTLNVMKMYKSFQQYFFDKTGSILAMKYSTYHRFFREQSCYSFRLPRTYVCDFCQESKLILNINYPCDSRKFDYSQNLAVSKLNVTSQFYQRLLWLYVFIIHCHNNDSSSFDCFLENEGQNNPNSVCLFLYDFIKKKMEQMKNIKKLVLLSDSCGGQNKNIKVVKFCAWLSKLLSVNIIHIFPVRGHSYNQNDRNFGLYCQVMKKIECIENPDQYFKVMAECRSNPEP
ncbi:hypothetical protein PR048_013810 [Dryococelus australis]|uniref:DUF7869 domain-containing protein n=1 Tax=Dryococelus australis TaxID=614101 RepID=A0ABQ9HT84_9NEOP|nr:hypothetical protein PR048_013810 [Dryococelus australis]